MQASKCEICGARARWSAKTVVGEAPVCDNICARAFRNGIDRGTQTEWEVRNMWRQPIQVKSQHAEMRDADYDGWSSDLTTTIRSRMGYGFDTRLEVS
jgi:hypothetical protein